MKRFPNKICERFAACVKQDPAAPAIVTDDRMLTRGDLDLLSNEYAAKLPSGAKRVGICMEHGPDMIAAILGALKIGAAYVPVEPDFPQARIRYMMENAQVDCVVHDDGIERFEGKSPNEELAYILYTSGTTGKPKGVKVTPDNVCNYIDAFAHEFHPTGDDVMLQYSVCSFDIFVEEVFSALLTGMALAIPSREARDDINALMDFVDRHGVTTISGFPYLLQELNELDEIPSSLRLLISGGDVLRARYVDRLLPKVHVYNTYGPSETTVCASYFCCTGSEPLDDGTYPVGRPVLGVDIRIVDDTLEELEPGTQGELLITGRGVSNGYVGDPPEQENFITLENGETAYRSGDLGYRDPEGNIVFLHRKDTQVMIDGRRVETAEVQNALCECEDVADGFVCSYVDEHDMPYLVAYFVPSNKTRAQEELDDELLRSEMADFLAPYMLPEHFVQMHALPHTPNGKVDTAALPHIER